MWLLIHIQSLSQTKDRGDLNCVLLSGQSFIIQDACQISERSDRFKHKSRERRVLNTNRAASRFQQILQLQSGVLSDIVTPHNHVTTPHNPWTVVHVITVFQHTTRHPWLHVTRWEFGLIRVGANQSQKSVSFKVNRVKHVWVWESNKFEVDRIRSLSENARK